MKANIEAILGLNIFDHVCYIVLPPKIILLDIYEYLVGILISRYHNYLSNIMGLVPLGHLQWRFLD